MKLFVRFSVKPVMFTLFMRDKLTKLNTLKEKKTIIIITTVHEVIL